MVYTNRIDGRKIDELRPMEAKVGIVDRATEIFIQHICKIHQEAFLDAIIIWWHFQEAGIE